jgi:acyl-coenzyme A thioesterase PaaI-like protein
VSDRDKEIVFAHDPGCLGCGTDNPASLGLRFTVRGDRVYAPLKLDDRHRGAPGFAHGGAVATALDDALGTLTTVLRRPGVTAKLEVNYRRPALIGREFEIEAWIDRVEGRKMHLHAEMKEDGEVVADAYALYLEVSIDHWGPETPAVWRKVFASDDPQLPY